jgi:inorganic pyrophosphatase
MPNLFKLPTWSEADLVHVVVETPRGGRAKLSYDPGLRTFVLSKSLRLGLSYPYDWGFIPSRGLRMAIRSMPSSFTTPRALPAS